MRQWRAVSQGFQGGARTAHGVPHEEDLDVLWRAACLGAWQRHLHPTGSEGRRATRCATGAAHPPIGSSTPSRVAAPRATAPCPPRRPGPAPGASTCARMPCVRVARPGACLGGWCATVHAGEHGPAATGTAARTGTHLRYGVSGPLRPCPCASKATTKARVCCARCRSVPRWRSECSPKPWW